MTALPMVSTELPGELGMMHLTGRSGYLIWALRVGSAAHAGTATNHLRRDTAADMLVE